MLHELAHVTSRVTSHITIGVLVATYCLVCVARSPLITSAAMQRSSSPYPPASSITFSPRQRGVPYHTYSPALEEVPARCSSGSQGLKRTTYRRLSSAFCFWDGGSTACYNIHPNSAFSNIYSPRAPSAALNMMGRTVGKIEDIPHCGVGVLIPHFQPKTVYTNWTENMRHYAIIFVNDVGLKPIWYCVVSLAGCGM